LRPCSRPTRTFLPIRERRVQRQLRVPCVAMRRLLLVIALLLAGCGSPASSTSTEPTAIPITPMPASTVTPGPTSAPSATPTSPCTPGQFEIGINNQQGAAGTIFATFEIRNTSTSDCTENGYAKLQMLTASGGLLLTSWSNDNSMASPGQVDLPPSTVALGTAGATGHGFFLVSWSDASCSGAAAETPKSWRIVLPTSGFEAVVAAMPLSMVCAGAIKVGPIKPAPYT
jgi:hypothetical protein